MLTVCLQQHWSRLKPLDIEFMKQLHHLVNIVPVIAKSDTLTPSEVRKLKLKVRNCGPVWCVSLCVCVCDDDERPACNS